MLLLPPFSLIAQELRGVVLDCRVLPSEVSCLVECFDVSFLRLLMLGFSHVIDEKKPHYPSINARDYG